MSVLYTGYSKMRVTYKGRDILYNTLIYAL
jgi:hypothetical protein